MKVMITNLIKFFFISTLLLCLAFCLSTIAQPVLKETSRIKDFGKSLKKDDERNGNNADKNEIKNSETIRIETNLVTNDVLVVNPKGNAIIGLKQSDFIVKEDEIEQQIELFSFGENAKIPRSIVLIFDYSGSLRPYINNSAEAAKMLVDKLSPQDRMAIVTDDVKLLVDFTKDKDLLKQTLDKLKEKTLATVGGKSLQYSALLAALNELFDSKDIHPIIILQSDGDEILTLKKGAGEYPISFDLRLYYNNLDKGKNFSWSDL